MIQKSLFKRAFILLALIGLLAVVDRNLYLTWNFWWFDKLMHFSAGAVVGMSSVLVLIYFQMFLEGKKKIMLVSLLSVLVVGLLWEYFELHYGITFLSDGAAYYKDTIGDIFMDLFGGVLGTVYSYKFLK